MKSLMTNLKNNESHQNLNEQSYRLSVKDTNY